jgi:hypothetical protein
MPPAIPLLIVTGRLETDRFNRITLHIRRREVSRFPAEARPTALKDPEEVNSRRAEKWEIRIQDCFVEPKTHQAGHRRLGINRNTPFGETAGELQMGGNNAVAQPSPARFPFSGASAPSTTGHPTAFKPKRP